MIETSNKKVSSIVTDIYVIASSLLSSLNRNLADLIGRLWLKVIFD